MGKTINVFNALVGENWKPSAELINEAELVEDLIKRPQVNLEKAESILEIIVREKLALTVPAYRHFINRCAEKKLTFNTHQKRAIKGYINRNEFTALQNLANSKKTVEKAYINQIIADIKAETDTIIWRNELKNFLNDNKSSKNDILSSLFASFFYNSFDKDKALLAFNADSHPDLSYYEYLKKIQPRLFERKQAAILLELAAVKDGELKEYRNWAISQIKRAYEELSNHSYFFISIEGKDKGQMWSLYGDLVLYAEKFISTELPKTFFKPKQIEAETKAYIKESTDKDINFSKAQIGFTFEDCFVLTSRGEEYSKILLAFVKNSSDETRIPCPACRSMNVRPNSYPKIGVRSWECGNPLCPDKSLYNRGKRYSFYSIIRQESINNPENLISDSHIKKWKFDIVYRTDHDEYKLIAEHYSLVNETIKVIATKHTKEFKVSSRRFVPIKELVQTKESYSKFARNDFFTRYIVDKKPARKHSLKNLSEDNDINIYCGDAYDVLSQLPDNSIDGAVTSPPYYNAREYSTWSNMYCYLYDIYNIHKILFKKLKPGAFYLYNIFDYFDNEKTIVFSDMGKKRVILGPYSLDIFKRIGFNIQGNIVWDKGEIEGKRFFNQGNDFPYYQRPYNSWEHIFILQKPPKSPLNFQDILQEKPVLKMFKGRNILGHTAPYPRAIPELLIKKLKKGTILDPFSGSMTSGRVAYEQGIKSINIELDKNYCELGISLWKSESQQIKLLDG